MNVAVEISEKEWQAQVIQLATMWGWKHYFTYRSKRSPTGFPDLTLARDRVIWAELKAGRGRPTPAQLEWLEALEAAGGEVYLWRPSDLDEVGRVLARRKQ
jgi:hypothetical protein